MTLSEFLAEWELHQEHDEGQAYAGSLTRADVDRFMQQREELTS